MKFWTLLRYNHDTGWELKNCHQEVMIFFKSQYNFPVVSKTVWASSMGCQNLNIFLITDNALIDDLTDQRRDDNEENIENEDSEGEFEDSNTTQLPQKIDEFLVYINDLYFDGELNMIDKRMFKMGEDLDEFHNDENDDNQAKEKSNPVTSRRRVVFSSD